MKEEEIVYFFLLLYIFSTYLVLPCHASTFLCTHSTSLSTHSTFFHFVLELFTFHSTCFAHISTHIAHLFYILTSPRHKARSYHTHIHTVTHHHYASCSHAHHILIHKTSCTASFTAFITSVAGINACLICWILKFHCHHIAVICFSTHSIT
jgi:hypothetical protein